MKPKTTVLILITFLFFGAILVLAGEFSWRLRKDREGIRISTRVVKNYPVHEFRGETTVPAQLRNLVTLYEQVDRMPEWFHAAKEAKLLKKISEHENLIYFAADLPWPLRDRDGVYTRVKTIDEVTGAVIYSIHEAKDFVYPEQKGRVRVTYLDAEWKFTPLVDGQTEATFRMHTEAGGYIPPALVNTFTVSLPFRTLQKFRALVEREQSKK